MEYDVVIIGAGPGGYVAAIRCAQLGLKTACIDAWLDHNQKPALGGTCLNVGCIPSKALLDSSHHFEFINKQAAEHGITADNVSIDIDVMMKRKDKVVRTLTTGIAGLFRKHQITWIQATAEINSAGTVSISTGETLQAKKILIATGSLPATLPHIPCDHLNIVDSTGALSFSRVPQRLVIIGSGVIGLELGSVWRRLGAQVTILEAMPNFLTSADQQIAEEALKITKKQNLDIHLGAKVIAADSSSDGIVVRYEKHNETQEIIADKVIVAIGRKPNTQVLGNNPLGITLDERGFIKVNQNFQTNIPHIYAVGDVIPGPMLAHKASEEGIAVAEHFAGQAITLNHATIPWVVYTWPEIAWVGKTEQALRADGQVIRVGTFPFIASGRAKAMGETQGLVKIISDQHTDRILGVHILGANASELISEAVVAMEFSASSEDLARTIHAHPTLAEVIHEAALAVDQRAIHI